MRVYLSSTYQDLVEYREAVARALRAFDVAYLAMEDYTASDDRPADKCIADVRRCDLYVLLLARRMGSGITRLEFEAARHEKKACLAFHLDPAFPWESKWVDPDASAINQFVTDVNAYRVTKTFTTPDNLRAIFVEALHRYLKDHPPKRELSIPELLPYRNDRTPQCDGLMRAWVRHQRERKGRPLVCIVHGREAEDHEMFLERLAARDLAEWGGRKLDPHEAVQARHHRLAWPTTGRVEERVDQFFMRLAQEVIGRPDVSLKEIAQEISQCEVPVVIESVLHEANWDASQPATIRAWLERWSREFPDTTGRHPPLVALCVKYSRDRTGLLAALAGSRSARIARMVAKLAYDGLPGISGLTLDRLTSIGWSDTDLWIDRDVKAFLDVLGNVPNVEVRSLLQTKAQKLLGASALPMSQLAPKLRNELKGAILEVRSS